MKETIISWNVENWLTVVLMAMVGFFVLGLATQGIRRLTAPKMGARGSNVVEFDLYRVP